MPEPDDEQLLREFAETNSETAFATLVARHVNLVYSTGLRFSGNRQHAEEISQAVFIILARKAGSLGKNVVLSGWLYQTARLTAANVAKGEIRRQRREQEAYMQSTLNEPDAAAWQHIAPLLDDVMGRLGETDRNAVVLRFFENKTAREVAAALHLTEAAAHKRVNRALGKLRKIFTRRGVDSTTALLSGVISANAVHVAPAGLAKTISTVALVKGTAASISTLTLVKGALKIMAWTKAKTAVVASMAAILAISTATVVVKEACFPVIKDVYFQPNYRHFQNLPRGLFVLRPTHFSTPAEGLEYSGETSSPSGEHVTLVMGRNRSFEQLMTTAYGGYQPYTVFPTNIPNGNYDYLCTILDGRSDERLQTAIRKKLGYTANWQERDTEVLLLTMRRPASPGLKAASGSKNSEAWRDSETRLEFRNRSLWNLANEIERAMNLPVLDQTGRQDALDFDLNCARTDLANRNWDSVNQALGQLGLELISTNLPTKMLVVEKAK